MWQMIAASVPGRSHLRRGVGCQDAYCVAELAKGGIVAAVADGLGSARLAAWDPGQASAGMLSLWAQPQGLDRLGLWPQGVPSLLKRSSSLQIGARALAAGGWSSGPGPSQFTGRLELP